VKSKSLEFENHMVMAAVEAFAGAISLEVDACKDTVDLYVALSATPDETVEELLDDVVFDIGESTEDAAFVTVRTWIGDDWVLDGWPGLHKRMVYAAYRKR
jgi:hypothetical protein